MARGRHKIDRLFSADLNVKPVSSTNRRARSSSLLTIKHSCPHSFPQIDPTSEKMHLPTLLSTILLAFPAAIMAKDCTQYEIFYYVSGPTNSLPNLAFFRAAFDKNQGNFEAWAGRNENGGGCGGFCTGRFSEISSKSGRKTNSMRCVAPRVRRTAGRPPDGVEGISVGSPNRKCDNNCVNNNSGFVKQDCSFTVSFSSSSCNFSLSG